MGKLFLECYCLSVCIDCDAGFNGRQRYLECGVLTRNIEYLSMAFCGLLINMSILEISSLSLDRRFISSHIHASCKMVLPMMTSKKIDSDLFLSSNSFTGVIPSDIGNLVNLYNLYINDNQFSGSIPARFGDLTRLRGASMFNNYFEGKVCIMDTTRLFMIYHSNNNCFML